MPHTRIFRLEDGTMYCGGAGGGGIFLTEGYSMCKFKTIGDSSRTCRDTGGPAYSLAKP